MTIITTLYIYIYIFCYKIKWFVLPLEQDIQIGHVQAKVSICTYHMYLF